MQYYADIVSTTALLLPQTASEAISVHLISTNFLGEHPPRTPLFLMLTHVNMYIRHLCNPLSENLGYGPEH